MIPAAFELVRPGTVEEALAALADPEARPIAGGHSLLPMMKLRFARPTALVDLAGLGLGGVEREGDALRIGALTTYDELLRADVALPDALREAVEAVGDLQVRNAGTLGGSVAHADPASDVAAALLALDATARLRSPAGTRELPVDELLLGPFTTAIEPQELLVELLVPRPAVGEGTAYASVEDAASGYPLAGAAARVGAEGLVLGLTGVADRPLRLAGPDGASLAAAVAAVEPAVEPQKARYRRQLASVVAARAVAAARLRSTGGIA
jgi:carbon-monoxide dehydrogenase medium subunit